MLTMNLPPRTPAASERAFTARIRTARSQQSDHIAKSFVFILITD